MYSKRFGGQEKGEFLNEMEFQSKVREVVCS